MALPPSGEQRELRWSDQRAVVVEIGGGLRSYDVGRHAVLDGYAEHEMASAGRGQLLLPWPNRLQAGRWTWDGAERQLAINELGKGAHGNAIHGLVRWAAWQLEQPEPQRVVARYALAPHPGYPFRLACAVEYELSDAGLQVALSVTNESDAPAPFGAGFHPYLAAAAVAGGGGAGGDKDASGTAATTVDELTLTVPGRTRLLVGDDGIPTGREPATGPSDLRGGRVVGDERLDTAWTDLERDADGWAHAVLEGPRGRATLSVDAAWRWLQVFTGDTLPQPERRHRGVAIEPMTCPPNALATGEDLVVVGPGEVSTPTWRLSLEM